MVIDQWLMLINHCSPTHLLDHIRFTAVMGDWYDSVSAVSRDTGGIIRVTQSRSPGHSSFCSFRTIILCPDNA